MAFAIWSAPFRRDSGGGRWCGRPSEPGPRPPLPQGRGAILSDATIRRRASLVTEFRDAIAPLLLESIWDDIELLNEKLNQHGRLPLHQPRRLLLREICYRLLFLMRTLTERHAPLGGDIKIRATRDLSQLDRMRGETIDGP